MSSSAARQLVIPVDEELVQFWSNFARTSQSFADDLNNTLRQGKVAERAPNLLAARG